MTVKDTRGIAHWALESGRYDISQHRRRMAIQVEPGNRINIPQSETDKIFHWLLNGPEGPRFDEQLTDPRQIIEIKDTVWRLFPSDRLMITYEVEYDPYLLPGKEPGSCE